MELIGIGVDLSHVGISSRFNADHAYSPCFLPAVALMFAFSVANCYAAILQAEVGRAAFECLC